MESRPSCASRENSQLNERGSQYEMREMGKKRANEAGGGFLGRHHLTMRGISTPKLIFLIRVLKHCHFGESGRLVAGMFVLNADEKVDRISLYCAEVFASRISRRSCLSVDYRKF